MREAAYLEEVTITCNLEFESAVPPLAPPFAISLTEPKYGWIGLRMLAGQISYDISLSYVFDPFDAIRLFLEQIAQGMEAELLIHDEGHSHSFRAGITDAEGLFRLGIWNTLRLQTSKGDDYDITLALDVMTVRDAFVRSFYQAIVGIWGLPDDLTFRRAWFNFDEDEDPYEDDYGLARTLPEVRSPALDHFLG